MEKLLEKYKNCNVFSLSTHYGNYYINEDEYRDIIKKHREFIYGWLKKSYDYQKDKMPYDYDTLFNDIYEECFEKNDMFIVDKLHNNLNKYPDVGCMWHMYYSINDLVMIEKRIDYYRNLEEKYDIDKEFDNDEIKDLKKYIKRYELSFATHCTLGPLSITFYFDLNDDTKKWLLNKKDIYDFNHLQDLALYKDNEILFSSCTHEEYYDEF